jgi:HK97 family phage portal protein
MRILGFDITRRKKSLQAPSTGRWFRVDDQFTGAWQQDNSIQLDTVLTFSAVFACVRLITSDIGKMPILLKQRQPSGIWRETTSPNYSPVLRKPNGLQTRIKFIEQWVTSKLIHGNAYIIKTRDRAGRVVRLQVLDPYRVETLISESGEAFYRLRQDRTTQTGDVTVPATEIIHDVHVTPEHPLIGVSPIGACGLTAMQGMNIQRNSEKFFSNMALPSGMLTAPGPIADSTAERLKQYWHENFSGKNVGKIAVAGDGLKFEGFTMSAVDAQLIDQLKWTAEDVCRAFGVPGYKIGVGTLPTYNNMSALNQSYYNDTLQELIECIELLLDEGLEMPETYRTELDLETLLRMDAQSRYETYEKALKSGWKSPNEVRAHEEYEPVEGGEEPIMQQQNWPLSVLAQRAPPDTAPPPPAVDEQAQEMMFLGGLTKELQHDRFSA